MLLYAVLQNFCPIRFCRELDIYRRSSENNGALRVKKYNCDIRNLLDRAFACSFYVRAFLCFDWSDISDCGLDCIFSHSVHECLPNLISLMHLYCTVVHTRPL